MQAFVLYESCCSFQIAGGSIRSNLARVSLLYCEVSHLLTFNVSNVNSVHVVVIFNVASFVPVQGDEE